MAGSSLSWRFDDEPGDEFKVRRFPHLFLLVRDDEAALGLQARDDAFLESGGDRFDRLQVVAAIRWELGLIH